MKKGVLSNFSDLDVLQMNLCVEEYTNHLGAVDNFTEVATSGNGSATEDATNHEMDLVSGITSTGYGYFQTKKTWTLSAKPIVVNFIVNNIVGGSDGIRVMYAGLRGNFASSTSNATGCGFHVKSDGTYKFRSANGTGYNDISISVSNGDLLTLVVTNTSVVLYKNGVFQAKQVAPYIPTGSLHAGATAISSLAGVTTSASISLDMINIKRYA